ncbi:MAG: DNA translocase FtsK [Patescibacteria group bacterium]|jgi:DNA segregation ATPase FtsK/SpoIIIE-like protein
MLTYTPSTKVPEERDVMFNEAVKLIQTVGMASASLIQRHLKLGYARSARLLDELEEAGVIGEAKGAKPREILIPHSKNGEYITPPPKEQPIKIPFEDTLAKWRKTKYADHKSSRFEIELGVDENNKKIVFDLEKFGNLYIVGSQFTSATDLLNSIIAKSLATYSPDELRLIAIDGAQGELVIPNQATHLLTPVIVELDKPVRALKWVVSEIDRRIKLEAKEKQPNILIVINSLNQIYYFSPSEIEDTLYWIILVGRRYGVSVIMRTDFPNMKLAKEIMANNPAEIFFKPASKAVARATGVPESNELTTPDEAILVTMYGGNQKITISKVRPKEIYQEIFE